MGIDRPAQLSIAAVNGVRKQKAQCQQTEHLRSNVPPSSRPERNVEFGLHSTRALQKSFARPGPWHGLSCEERLRS